MRGGRVEEGEDAKLCWRSQHMLCTAGAHDSALTSKEVWFHQAMARLHGGTALEWVDITLLFRTVHGPWLNMA